MTMPKEPSNSLLLWSAIIVVLLCALLAAGVIVLPLWAFFYAFSSQNMAAFLVPILFDAVSWLAFSFLTIRAIRCRILIGKGLLYSDAFLQELKGVIAYLLFFAALFFFSNFYFHFAHYGDGLFPLLYMGIALLFLALSPALFLGYAVVKNRLKEEEA